MYVHMNGLSFFDNVVTWYRCRAEHICNKVVKNVSFHQDPILTNLSNDFWVFCDRVARWYIFKPKIPISVNFGRFWNGKNWYTYFMPIWSIFRPFDKFYAHLVYFSPFWYIFTHFGILYQAQSGNPGLRRDSSTHLVSRKTKLDLLAFFFLWRRFFIKSIQWFLV
jgi:hypothetical protein